jgi:hypothetical protein
VNRPAASSRSPPTTALGRSRGGWTTKVHLACEQGQKVLAIVVTAGRRGDSPQFPAGLSAVIHTTCEYASACSSTYPAASVLLPIP